MCVFIETEKKVETKSKKAYSKLSRILKTKKKSLSALKNDSDNY